MKCVVCVPGDGAVGLKGPGVWHCTALAKQAIDTANLHALVQGLAQRGSEKIWFE